ncbi:MAG: MJ0042-type zinc finger domain-containing protein, partial [Marinobacter sp.]
MTQSSLQTRCPKCETRFRVTDAQLSVASGKVRCGNCMAVFNAVEHQMNESPSGNASATSGPFESEKQDAPADQRFTSDDDLIFADNPEEDAAEGPYAGTRLTFSDDELSDSFRTVDERSGGTFETDSDDETHEKIDESWAEAMLSEEDDTKRKAKPAPVEPEPPEEPAEFEQPESEPPENEPFEEQAWDEPETTPREPEDLSLEPVDNADGFYVDDPRSSSFDYDAGPVTDNEPLVAGSPYSNLRREPV